MDTKKVRAMLLAVETGSLTAAAEQLGYTQSGMTHMMNALEDELGMKILVRSKTGVHLSPFGKELYDELDRLDKAAERLENHASELRSKGLPILRLGAYSSMARQWVPAIMAEMRKQCPDIEIDVTMFSRVDETYAAVNDGHLDCAICSHVLTAFPNLTWIHLKEDPLLAVLPADTELSGDCFPVEGFNGREFFMPSGGFELDIVPALEAGGKDCKPRIRYTNLDDASLASMVAHGLGVTVLSDLVMQSIRDRVVALPLSPSASRSLGMIFGKSRANDKNIVRLVNCTRKTIKAMYNDD